MKKYTYIFLLIFSLVQLSACTNKFLDAVPYSTTTVENFYKTPADAESALAGCYNILVASDIQDQGDQYGLFRAIPYVAIGSTDEAVTRDGFAVEIYAPWGLASWTSNTEFVRVMWLFSYAGINRCNYLLEKIGGINMDATRKNQIIAEARFLRGLFHMYLGMMYGGVPVVTTSTPDPTAPRQPLEQVFNQIIADYQFAYDNLPDRGKSPGEANKWAAAGFLAKTYIYLASCKANNVGADLNFPLNSFSFVNSPDMYAKAKVLTTAIIAGSGYKLTADYKYLFYETTSTLQSEECLFAIESGSDPQYDYGLYWVDTFLPNGMLNVNGGGLARLVPTGEMYQRYNATDLRRAQNLTRGITAASTTENVNGSTYYVPLAIANPATAAFYISKFRQRIPSQKGISPQRTDGNYPLLRYGDILLLHAEAIYFTTGDETLARTFLSQVRKRATTAATSTVLDNAYKKTSFVTELLDERSRELCFEGQRRFDLIRFGVYTSTINSLTGDKSLGFYNTVVPQLKNNWKPYRIWVPIPTLEIDLNKNLVQNPGY